MTKELATNNLKDIQQNISQLQSLISNEKKEIEIEMNAKIKAVYKKYEPQMNDLNEKKWEVQKILNQFTIEEANHIWYPVGTIVHLWEYSGSSWQSNRKLEKTDKTGVVAIYGKDYIEIAQVGRYSPPSIGDIIVMWHKKDGSVGLKFEIIATNGSLNRSIPHLYSAEDTPTDNLITRKKANHETEIN